MLGLLHVQTGLLVPTFVVQPPVLHAYPAPVRAPVGVAAPANLFPSTDVLAFIQPAGLGSAKANRANPSAGGNAEGNWWTPSSALDTDCEGKPVTPTSKLTQECIYQKKVAEIRSKQAITEQNAVYKTDMLAEREKRVAAAAARKTAADAELAAKRAKYASRR
uniref:Uncharacterized protein n=1 Tax=Prymnesium polylepis TaxID=72548 RepID=A0A7S4MNX5_9EUKA